MRGVGLKNTSAEPYIWAFHQELRAEATCAIMEPARPRCGEFLRYTVARLLAQQVYDWRFVALLARLPKKRTYDVVKACSLGHDFERSVHGAI